MTKMRYRVSSGQCLSLSRIVILTSMMSAAISLATITVIMILLTLQDVWTLLIEIIKHWILRQQWDLSVSSHPCISIGFGSICFMGFMRWAEVNKCFIDMIVDYTRHYFVPRQHIRKPQPPALPRASLHHPAFYLLAAPHSRHQTGQEGAAPALAGHPSHHHSRQNSYLQLHNLHHLLHWSPGVCGVPSHHRNSAGGLPPPLEAGLCSL